MTTKIIKWGSGHILQCHICFEMERRGYLPKEEDKYWDDVFDNKEKPVKYKMIKGFGKNKGKEYKRANHIFKDKP